MLKIIFWLLQLYLNKFFFNYFQKSAAKQLSNSLKRSFFCKPSKQTPHQSTLQRQLYTKHPQPTYSKYNDSQLQSNEYNFDNANNDTLNKSAQIYSNSSDYNLITRYKEKQADLTKLQAQTLNNICSTNNYGTLTTPTTSNSCNLPMINDIYSTINRQNSANKTKQLASPTNGLEETYLDASISQKPMDLNHMVSTLDAAAKQTPNMQSTSIYAKSSYSNTLSMTRSKNNDNILSNGTLNEYTTKILNANNSNSDEHSLIASYCSRLAEFYAKNQHLSPSPTSSSPPATTPQPTSKFKSNMKPKTTFINDENPPSAYETLKSNRTSSLSRHAWSSSKYATNKPSSNGQTWVIILE